MLKKINNSTTLNAGGGGGWGGPNRLTQRPQHLSVHPLQSAQESRTLGDAESFELHPFLPKGCWWNSSWIWRIQPGAFDRGCRGICENADGIKLFGMLCLQSSDETRRTTNQPKKNNRDWRNSWKTDSEGNASTTTPFPYSSTVF